MCIACRGNGIFLQSENALRCSQARRKTQGGPQKMPLLCMSYTFTHTCDL